MFTKVFQLQPPWPKSCTTSFYSSPHSLVSFLRLKIDNWCHTTIEKFVNVRTLNYVYRGNPKSLLASTPQPRHSDSTFSGVFCNTEDLRISSSPSLEAGPINWKQQITISCTWTPGSMKFADIFVGEESIFTHPIYGPIVSQEGKLYSYKSVHWIAKPTWYLYLTMYYYMLIADVKIKYII